MITPIQITIGTPKVGLMQIGLKSPLMDIGVKKRGSDLATFFINILSVLRYLF
jgi:hypothetical protein